ncbi:MAG: hypothetical protein AAF490_11280 [Chloroflexota bacterium]
MNKNTKIPQLDGKIILLAVLIATVASILITMVTGDHSVWGYMIPLGVTFGTIFANKKNTMDS